MALKSVLITGTSAGGIGSSLAFEFQKRGFLVFATARNTSKIDPKLTELSNVEIVALDVTSASSIASAVEKVKNRTDGRLDVLVNNSGGGYHTAMLDLDMEQAKQLWDVNFWGVLAVTKAFAPLLIAAKGAVLNNSSIAGEIYMPFQGLYQASKAAITSVGETTRIELEPFGVRVVSAITGAVHSKFFQNLPDYSLPADSLYAPLEENYKSMVRGEHIPGGKMDADVYSEKVVKDLIGGANGKIYRGKLSTTVHYLMALAPRWLIDIIMRSKNGLETLQKPSTQSSK